MTTLSHWLLALQVLTVVAGYLLLRSEYASKNGLAYHWAYDLLFLQLLTTPGLGQAFLVNLLFRYYVRRKQNAN
jgi:hypothetical protein